MRREAGRRLLITLAERTLPPHTALLIVDMQNDYISIGGAADRRGGVAAQRAIIPQLQTLLAAARAVGTLVVYLQMTFDPELRVLSDVEFLRRRRNWGDTPVLIKGTWGHEIIPELAPAPGELVVEKTRPSGFIGTSLDLVLRSNGIRSAVVVGLATNACVNATARDALAYDYYVTVVSDCVTSRIQQMHDAAVYLLESYIGYDDGIVTSDRILREWSGFGKSTAIPIAGEPAERA